MRDLFFRFCGIWVQIFLWGSWIDALCTFVHDLYPSNSGFGIRFEDFGWFPRFSVELGCDSIPSNLVRLRSHVLRHSVP
jgi:hypothetical protein